MLEAQSLQVSMAAVCSSLQWASHTSMAATQGSPPQPLALKLFLLLFYDVPFGKFVWGVVHTYVHVEAREPPGVSLFNAIHCSFSQGLSLA